MSFCQDTKLNLSKLHPYLQTIAAREMTPEDHCTFVSYCCQRIKQYSSSFPVLEPSGTEVDTHLCLTDMEMWVQDCLVG